MLNFALLLFLALMAYVHGAAIYDDYRKPRQVRNKYLTLTRLLILIFLFLNAKQLLYLSYLLGQVRH